MINIKYKDQTFEYENPITLFDLVEKVKDNFDNDVIAGFMDNKLCSLSTPITKDCTVDFYDYKSLNGNRVYLRGLYFLFVKATKDVLNCDVKIMRVMGKEVYSLILSNKIISEATIQEIKLRMDKLVEANLPIEKIVVSKTNAMDYYKRVNQIDKADALKYISNSSISLYKMDDALDYFYGVMPVNTGVLSKYELKYIKENRVVLVPPSMYDKDDSKYVQNDKIIEEVKTNNTCLENIGVLSVVDLNNLISHNNYKDIIKIGELMIDNRLLSIVNKMDKEEKVILLNGPSYSGKTMITEKIRLLLKSKGYDTISVFIDDFYKEKENRDLEGGYEKENINNIDTNLFNKVISDLLDGKEVEMPKYDYEVDERRYYNKKVKLKDNSVIIVNGVHSFNDKLTEIIPDKNKLKLFVSPFTPLNIDNHNLFRSSDCRLLRKIAKDSKRNNVNVSSSLSEWRKIRKNEEEAIYPYANEADEVVNTSLIYELSVLKTYVEPLLFSVEDTDENYEEALRLLNMLRAVLVIPGTEVPEDSVLKEFV